MQIHFGFIVQLFIPSVLCCRSCSLSLCKTNNSKRLCEIRKMLKFVQKFSHHLERKRRYGPSIFRVPLYSTQTHPSASPLLLRRLQQCNEQRVSVIPVLEEWAAAQDQTSNHLELKHIMKIFRESRRFKPALEISEWMSSKMKDFAVSPGLIAIQLDLISKVHGLEQAEKFFNSLDDGLKVTAVYSAMLKCYADVKSLEKAEATMEEIRKMNTRSTLTYNTLLSVYYQMGKHEKLDLLIHEMERKGVDYNVVTYNIRLNAYADSDWQGMEKLLRKMEADPMASPTFHTYSIAAKGFIRASELEKASTALKKAEHMIRGHQRGFAYAGLISLYAKMHKREDVYRLWGVLHGYGKLHFGSYISMLSALDKLDDLDGVKKIVEELLEKETSFDIRIPNLAICAYCRRGEVEEAEFVLNKFVEKGKEPSGTTWGHMALGYFKSGRMEEVVEAMKKALTGRFPVRKPDLDIVAACVEYLKKKGDEKEVEELLALLEKFGSFSAEFRERTGRYMSS